MLRYGPVWLSLYILTSGCALDRPGVPLGDVGDVGDVSAWWSTDYQSRRAIAIAADTAAVPEGASVWFSADTAALINAGELLGDGRDWRVVRHADGDEFIELARWIDDGEGGGWNSASTRTWFRVMEEIAAASSDARTYVYYNHAAETEPAPAELNDVFVFGDDFESDIGKWRVNERGEQFELQATAVRAGRQALLILPGGQQLAGLHRDHTLPTAPLLVSHYLRQSQTGASFGNLRLYQTTRDQIDVRWRSPTLRGGNELDSGDRLKLWERNNNFPVWFDNYGVDTWRLVEFAYDQPQNRYRARVDGGEWSMARDDYNGTGETIRSFALDGEGQNGAFQVDNYIIRLHVDPEPEIALGPVETAP